MRLSISHRTTYHYAPPATRVIQVLRLTPRNHDGQYVVRWRIDVSADCRLDQHEDAFGNITHAFAADGPLPELSLLVEGEVETRDAQGIVRDAVERFPPSLFLRETALTACDADIAALRGGGAASGPRRRAQGAAPAARAACTTICTGTTDPTYVADHGGGGLRGSSTASARTSPISSSPRRAASAFRRAMSAAISAATTASTAQNAGHAWAEAFVPDLGWVAFDPANGICATDAHARVAVGLDHLGAAPVRGMRYGGGTETLAVDIHVDQASRQTQS